MIQSTSAETASTAVPARIHIPVPESGSFPLITFGESLQRAIARHPHRVALRTIDDAMSLTWRQYGDQVRRWAGILAGVGVERADTVALMMSNRVEFHAIDAGASCLGAAPFSVYNTNPAEAISYVVGDSGARVAVIESRYIDVFTAAAAELPGIETILVIDANGPFADPRMVGPARFDGSAPAGFDFDAACTAVQLEDILTLVYTSGTTGPPRGVELSHRSIMHTAFAVAAKNPPPDGGEIVSSLPMAHIAERMHSQYLSTITGFTITVCPDTRQLIDYVRQVRPQWWFSPPRTWQKLKIAIESWVSAEPDPDARAEYERTIELGLERIRLEQAGEPVPAYLAEDAPRARALFSPFLARLGLDRLMFSSTGAAPCPSEIIEFFAAIGLPVFEGWGLTECGSFGTMNNTEQWRIGSIGTPMPGMEIAVAEDGEILLRGLGNMSRYRNMPELTAKTLGADGWLRTGDIGSIDDDGYVWLRDRKKELIINAAGKNMSPSHIESMIKNEGPLIDQVCVIGDGQPYNSAILTLDATAAVAAAQRLGISATDVQVLANETRIVDLVDEGIQRANARLSRVEQIKKFTILPAVWEPAGDELTPTMKLRRRPIATKYSDAIDAMYH